MGHGPFAIFGGSPIGSLDAAGVPNQRVTNVIMTYHATGSVIRIVVPCDDEDSTSIQP
ncbi:hypothetical protein BTIS_0188 [Bifidobacterium tissieri]|uniref:Uncharacterized protein n=1 Tax=Bifidobacterium tissieri TaxID=1630162 RepID=A0A261FJ39_9BIFI|nr:hypothetical protein BTIS_0188 [Bifidobacterium tissieri]